MNKNFKTLLNDISTFIFDVDGVLTDNRVLLLESGELARSMSIRDGYAMKVAVQQGYHIAVISGGKYPPVEDRLKGLGVSNVFLGVDDKEQVFENYLQEKGISWGSVMYMGDDIPDMKVMKKAGLPACPYDAVHEIRSICEFVSHKKGGDGCVRDAIEQTLRLKGLWPQNDGMDMG